MTSPGEPDEAPEDFFSRAADCPRRLSERLKKKIDRLDRRLIRLDSRWWHPW